MKPKISEQKKALLGVKYVAGNGREYTLMWTTNAACMAEMHGLSLNAGANTNTRAVLFACLLSCHPEVTIEECGDFIDEEQVRGNAEKLALAIRDAQEKSSGPAKKDPPSPATESPEIPSTGG